MTDCLTITRWRDRYILGLVIRPEVRAEVDAIIKKHGRPDLETVLMRIRDGAQCALRQSSGEGKA